MPFNGSGGWTPIAAPNYPAVAGQPIYASQFNANMADIFGGFANCLTRDGQSSWSANQNANSFTITSMADANANGKPLVYGQTTAAALGGALSLGGILYLVLGAVGAPSYSFTGDTDTGMWSPAANTLAWSVGGAELMRGNATGLGVGGTPSYRLHAWASGSNAIVMAQSTDASGVRAFIQSNSSTDARFGTLDNVPVLFMQNSAERARIDTASRFLVATTSVGIGGNANALLSIGGGATGAYYSAKASGTQELIAGADVSGVVIGAFSNHKVAVRTNNVDRVTVDTSGNVGIGVASFGAGEKLRVHTAAADYSWVRVGNTVNDLYIGVRDTGEGAVSSAGAYPLNFYTNGAERMRVMTGGQVVIGATTNAGIGGGSDLFAVAGTIGVSGAQFNANPGASTQFGFVNRSASAGFDFYSNAGGIIALRVFGDGRLAGRALHNNAGAVTGTTDQFVASGTYTATGTTGTNVTGFGTLSGNWKRVGNVVTVAVRGSVTTTAGSGTASDFGISLPIASNLTASGELSGTFCGSAWASGVGREAGDVSADTTNDRAQVNFNSAGTGVRNFSVIFQYVVA